MRQISIAIPTFNRVQMLFESFEKVIDNDLINEVVIVDDASEKLIYYKIVERAKRNTKIAVYRNDENLDCYQNKMAAIFAANNDWCILLDSDNQIDFDYLYRISQVKEWKDNTAYLPSFAKPHFDYRKYEGIEITKENVAEYMDDSTFTTMLNTANYFVNREFYLKCWDGTVDPHTSDSIYMNYLYLKNGGKLFVVPSLHYQHRVDNHGSEESGHYQKNCTKTGDFHLEVIQKLKALR